MYIKIDGHNVYYQKVGKGKDLILLHGWGQDVSTWWGVIDKLKEQFTLWLIDLPGFGRSDNLKRTFGVLDYAKVVEQFIKKQKLNKPHFLGHSLGGRIGIKLAANNPELLDKLVLEDSAGIRPKETLMRGFFWVLSKTANLLIPEWKNFRQRLRQSFYASKKLDYYSAGDLRSTLVAVVDEDLQSSLAKIKNQTLILWGGKDNITPVYFAKIMYKKIPESKLEIIENAGHFPHLQTPDEFLYFVKDFLS